jgi:hypothetical protein
MMVRIDDRQLGLEDLLGALGEPVVAHRRLDRRHLRRRRRSLSERGVGRQRGGADQTGARGQHRPPRYRRFGGCIKGVEGDR